MLAGQLPLLKVWAGTFCKRNGIDCISLARTADLSAKFLFIDRFNLSNRFTETDTIKTYKLFICTMEIFTIAIDEIVCRNVKRFSFTGDLFGLHLLPLFN